MTTIKREGEYHEKNRDHGNRCRLRSSIFRLKFCAGQYGDDVKQVGLFKSPLTRSAVELRMSMRKLWEDHITWTRNYIISSLADLEDTGKVAERLLKNQDDIGVSIQPCLRL